jgi:16S rRNA (cytosine967-C5)-methyltransferase
VISAADPRAAALALLRRWEQGRAWADEMLHAELAHTKLSAADKKLLVELFYGVIRWRALLDWVIASRCREKTSTGDIAHLLRLGVYQILLLDRVPDHAAVHETVKLAPTTKRGFPNALLRRVTREKAQIQLSWEQLERDDPATAFSHPPFLVERWRKQFGAERTVALLEWNNQPPPIFARVNTLRATIEQLREELRREDVVVRDSAVHPLCLEIEPPGSIERLGSFQAGHFYVQDPSTLLAVDLLDPQPGEIILDACAAPGGKTTYIAQKMQNRGQVIAADASSRRLKLVTENAERLGVSIVGTQHSALSTQHSFDRILVDAPCSNTGVLRRRVDLRWRIKESEIARLAKMQREILDRVAPALKPGGRLVYSTCSLETEENEQVVSAFLERHGDFHLVEKRTMFPAESNMDGAFVAVLARHPPTRPL